MSDQTEDADDPGGASTLESQSGTLAVTSNYKVLGELSDSSGVGVLGQNNAGSGTPIGVKGVVPNSSEGYGLETPDAAKIEGRLDTGATDFVVEAGTTTTVDAQNVVAGHASNAVLEDALGVTIAGGGKDDGSTPLRNLAYDNYSTIGGGQDNAVGSNTVNPSDDPYATVSGGKGNDASAEGATVGGGKGNSADGGSATVAGGDGNTAFSTWDAVGGGTGNEANGGESTVAGGNGNVASGVRASVGGGIGNEARGAKSTVGGGRNNTADGRAATVPGGNSNDAVGQGTFAAGEYAAADDDNSFVWNDGSGASDSSGSASDQFSSSTSGSVSGADTFNVKSTGGARFITSADNSKETYLAAGSSGWNTTSTRTAKTNISPVDPEQVLEALDDVAVSTWSYTDEDGSGAGDRHMGPMAEEFTDAFDLGANDRSINSINADGVAFAAIQGLSQKLDVATDEIAEKNDRIEDLESENEQLLERLATIEDRLGLEPASDQSLPADD